MFENYKYNPSDYHHILGMEADMRGFYEIVEKYRSNETDKDFVELQLTTLLFTMKHREVEGSLSHEKVREIGGYMWGLLDD